MLNALSDQRPVLSSSHLPGPTGESNKLSVFPIGRVLCLGPTFELAIEHASAVQRLGCQALIVCPGANLENAIDGFLPPTLLTELDGFAAVICAADDPDLVEIRMALAARPGALVPLITEDNIAELSSLKIHLP